LILAPGKLCYRGVAQIPNWCNSARLRAMTAAVRLFLLTGAVAGALLMQGVCRADGCCPVGCGGGCCCAYDALWYASGPSPANSATLTVWVPPGTDVYVDGKLMTGNGVKRRYYLTNLQTDPGTGEPLWYKCTVQADVLCRRTLGELPANIELTAIWVRDERRLSLSREVYVKAGDRVQLPFSPDVMTFR
jgi:hypothetical protein